MTAVVQEEQQIRTEYDKLRSKECKGCSRLEESVRTKDKMLEERVKYVNLVDCVKEKCVEYLSRPLALQDIPDVVRLQCTCVHPFIGDEVQ